MMYCQLDSVEITKAIVDQDLKRWWVAEQAGIHKTTLRRWISGRIERVKCSHAEQLARVLTVPVTAITRAVEV